jgi:hypothetical protein
MVFLLFGGDGDSGGLGVAVEADAREGDEQRQCGQDRGTQGDRGEAEAVVERRAAEPGTDRVAEVEGGDVEAGREIAADMPVFLQHTDLQGFDGGER